MTAKLEASQCTTFFPTMCQDWQALSTHTTFDSSAIFGDTDTPKYVAISAFLIHSPPMLSCEFLSLAFMWSTTLFCMLHTVFYFCSHSAVPFNSARSRPLPGPYTITSSTYIARSQPVSFHTPGKCTCLLFLVRSGSASTYMLNNVGLRSEP